MEELHTDLDITLITKKQRLQWLGHIWRMDGDRNPRRLWVCKQAERRRRKRPRVRWGNKVVRDLEKAEVVDWNGKATCRRLWERTKQAMGHVGLS